MNWMRWYCDAEDAGEGLGQRRLGDAGHAFEQHVAAGEQGDEELVRDVLHADDDAADLGDDAVAQAAHPAGPGRGSARVRAARRALRRPAASGRSWEHCSCRATSCCRGRVGAPVAALPAPPPAPPARAASRHRSAGVDLLRRPARRQQPHPPQPPQRPPRPPAALDRHGRLGRRRPSATLDALRRRTSGGPAAPAGSLKLPSAQQRVACAGRRAGRRAGCGRRRGPAAASVVSCAKRSRMPSRYTP